jgi:hypothetical protein
MPKASSGATATAAVMPRPEPVNPAYRLQIYSQTTSKLSATQSWTLQYQFTVPPLPTSPTWNCKLGTVYQWGDVDFDAYGSAGAYKLSDYRFNQIVPELILGSVLDASDAKFKPSWSQRRTWAIEAQYYWYNATTSKSYAQTGNIVGVNPGDEIATTIRYEAQTGTIVASIADGKTTGSAGVSTITIVGPFPNDPSLFTSWTDFFKRALAASHTSYVLSTPVVDVETDYLDQETMCGLLPFTLRKISIPGVASVPSAFSIQQLGGFTCKQPVAALDF